MKIFISWSKENSTSHDVATALHSWLPDVIQGVEPWMSTHDIQSGELWGSAVSKQLEENSYGILSITPQSMHAPWLVFEAGALTKFVDKARVCPYLSNMTSTGLTGPLTQLQSRLSDKNGTLKLVHDINKHLEFPISDDRLQRTFKRCWPELAEILKKAYEQDDAITSKTERRDDRELLEEMLTLVRQISSSSKSSSHQQLLDISLGQENLFDSGYILRSDFEALIKTGASISDLESLYKRAIKSGQLGIASEIKDASDQTRERVGLGYI